MVKGNIGIFDSGLGGLWVLKHLKEKLPEYNYIFLGDQANVPFGNKTPDTSVITFSHTYKNNFS